MKIHIPKVNISKNLMPGAVIIAAILVVGAYGYINRENLNSLSSQKAAEKAIAFINENIQAGTTASLMSVTDEGRVYKIHLKIVENEYDSYITKDGKFLFPTGIDIQTIDSQKAPAQEVTTQDVTTTASAAFAQCLTAKGVKFYGAWWCTHCQNQKKMFGDALPYVNYIECEQVPGTSQGSMTDACKTAKIESFPTWDFAGGVRNTGEMTLEKLSEISGCSL